MINYNMRCIEICLFLHYTCKPKAINYNMRCIEMSLNNNLVEGAQTINYNMRCIEILSLNVVYDFFVR